MWYIKLSPTLTRHLSQIFPAESYNSLSKTAVCNQSVHASKEIQPVCGSIDHSEDAYINNHIYFVIQVKF
jgi:hypothetical protein